MSEDVLVTIRTYDNEMDATHDRILLENEGIMAVPSGMWMRYTQHVELRVREADAARANDILNSVGRI
jgi:hypothetical protein